MTEQIRCNKCGQLLYFGEEISRRLYMRAVPDEAALLAAYGNTCPRCAQSLGTGTVDIEVKGRLTHGAQ